MKSNSSSPSICPTSRNWYPIGTKHQITGFSLFDARSQGRLDCSSGSHVRLLELVSVGHQVTTGVACPKRRLTVKTSRPLAMPRIRARMPTRPPAFPRSASLHRHP